MKVAVVGHIEWVEFARVDHVPEPGEILSAHETWEEAAGGGAVAAVQLANLAGSCLFFTALADAGATRLWVGTESGDLDRQLHYMNVFTQEIMPHFR